MRDTILDEALQNLTRRLMAHIPVQYGDSVKEQIREWAKERVQVFSAERIEERENLLRDVSYINHCKKHMAHEFAEKLWNECSENRDWDIAIRRAPNFRADSALAETLNMPRVKKLSVQIFAFKRLDK